ncbi:MAG: hypothetical protein COW84_01105 [Gammaproteobacteria bacterium CG22_combo_CG10-13_8_21_14_all_40_8]|nr:MAG: hypothetical protein COW84_01105 [Gammaproteobacteria bacterium CG22_combo_CG10-13_8_21_14_all_40_8]
MNYAKYLWHGIAFFIIFVIATAPAQVLQSSFNKVKGLNVEGLSGSLWHGHASQVIYNDISLGQADWDLSGWSLILMRLSLDVSLKSEQSNLSSHLILQSSSVEAENLKARFPAPWVSKLTKVPFQAQGQLFVRMKQAKISNSGAPFLYGALSWQDATLKTPFGKQAQLGTINVGLTTEEEWIVSDIRSSKGSMDLRATVRVNYPKEMAAKGSVSDQLSTELHGFFSLFTKPDNEGRLVFDYKGGIPAL